MVEGCSHKAVVESSSLSISTVLVAQSGRAEDCGSSCHGFESHLTPQYTHIAQLVRAGILYIQGQGFKSLCEYYILDLWKVIWVEPQISHMGVGQVWLHCAGLKNLRIKFDSLNTHIMPL